jgi:redox-sensitive bicupin YhaK (pirin superfamily)
MMLVRKSAARVRDVVGGQDTLLTFGPTAGKPFDRFGSLEVFREGRFVKRAAVSEPRNNAEIITYVYSGNLAFEDSRGLTGVLRQGEFQRMTAGSGLRYSEMNISTEHEACIFQFWLRPDRQGLHPGHEKRRFTVAERRGHLRLVASPGGLDGSLSIHQDAFLYSAILATGQHVVHPIGAGRGAWIHVVQGSLTVGEVVLERGDGAGVSEEDSARMLITEATEILLLDLGDLAAKRNNENGTTTNPPAAFSRPGGKGVSVLQAGAAGDGPPVACQPGSSGVAAASDDSVF